MLWLGIIFKKGLTNLIYVIKLYLKKDIFGSAGQKEATP